MLDGRITYIIIIQAVFIENKADLQWSSFTPELVNHTQIKNLENDFSYKKMNFPEVESRCEYKGTNGCDEAQHSGRNRIRFLDLGTNSSKNDNEMEAPAGKFSFFNLLSSGEEEGEGGGEEDDLDIESVDYEDGEKVKGDEEEEEDEEEDDYVGINLFGDDEEIALNKLKDKNDEGFLKQYHRHRVRMQNVIFPLLMAYKLKFFTVLPLLLGSLVLLIGTTGVAGFFFALFAAALGLHVKAEHD